MDLENLVNETAEFLVLYGVRIAMALLILLIGRWVARMLGSATERALNRRNIDGTVSQFMGRLVFALIMIFTIVAALSHVGIQTASIIAALGAAGLAVGLALQGSLANFAAGVLMVVFRPCRVGDYVEAGGCAGTIRNISLFSTTMTTPDNKQVIIPNSAIMSGAITNYSAMPQRRVDMVFGISYSADIRLAKQEIEKIFAEDPRVLKDPAPTIAVIALEDSSVNIAARPWVDSANYWPVFWDLTERIKLRFDEVGVSIPFPQMDVHLHRQEA